MVVASAILSPKMTATIAPLTILASDSVESSIFGNTIPSINCVTAMPRTKNAVVPMYSPSAASKCRCRWPARIHLRQRPASRLFSSCGSLRSGDTDDVPPPLLPPPGDITAAAMLAGYILRLTSSEITGRPTLTRPVDAPFSRTAGCNKTPAATASAALIREGMAR